MNYTASQYALMGRLVGGVIYDELDDFAQWELRYLVEEGIAQSRCDVKDGLYKLTPHGSRVLNCWWESLSDREDQLRLSQEKAKQAADDAAKQKADDRKEKRRDYRHDTWLVFLAAILSNLDRIIVAVIRLLQDG